jgi:hypothetical protein
MCFGGVGGEGEGLLHVDTLTHNKSGIAYQDFIVCPGTSVDQGGAERPLIRVGLVHPPALVTSLHPLTNPLWLRVRRGLLCHVDMLTHNKEWHSPPGQHRRPETLLTTKGNPTSKAEYRRVLLCRWSNGLAIIQAEFAMEVMKLVSQVATATPSQ